MCPIIPLKHKLVLICHIQKCNNSHINIVNNINLKTHNLDIAHSIEIDSWVWQEKPNPSNDWLWILANMNIFLEFPILKVFSHETNNYYTQPKHKDIHTYKLRSQNGCSWNPSSLSSFLDHQPLNCCYN